MKPARVMSIGVGWRTIDLERGSMARMAREVLTRVRSELGARV